MREDHSIPLTQGKVAIIDADDADCVRAFRWHAFLSRGKWYAARKLRDYEAPRRPSGCQRSIFLHRFLLGCVDGEFVDHIDGDGLNNRRGNLRLATRTQNGANRGLQSNNTSGFVGVYWNAKTEKWVANIRIHGKTRYIASYDAIEDAARAYDAAAIECFGQFAHLNLP